MKPLLSLLTFLLLAAGATAQDFALQRHSEYHGSSEDRNPFVPIGWKKRLARQGETAQQAAAPRITLGAQDFTVSSILVGDPSLAVVNGRELSEGELAEVSAGGRKVPVRVMSIRDGAVTLQHDGVNIVAQLRSR